MIFFYPWASGPNKAGFQVKAKNDAEVNENDARELRSLLRKPNLSNKNIQTGPCLFDLVMWNII